MQETKTIYTNLIETAIKDAGTIAECYSLFHNYSLLNSLYVGIQQRKRFGQVTPIKGFRAWNDLNRKVKKGEKALEVLFPIFGYFPDKDENGEIKKNPKTGKPIYIKYVKDFQHKHIHFAYSQTEILNPDKEDKAKDETLSAKGFEWKKVCEKFEIEIVDYNMVDGNCQGWARVGENKLAINPVAANPEKTAVHEIAHILLKHDKSDLPRNLKEVQAETVNYIIHAMMKADEQTLSESRGYIQNWLGKDKITEEIAKPIINIANKILEAGTGKESKGD